METKQMISTTNVLYHRITSTCVQTYHDQKYHIQIGQINQQKMKEFYSQELINIFNTHGFPLDWKIVINSNGKKRGEQNSVVHPPVPRIENVRIKKKKKKKFG